MVYHRQRIHLTEEDARALSNGNTVKIPVSHYHKGHEVHLTTGQMRKMEAGRISGRGMNLKMRPSQVNYHRKNRLGGGVFDVLKALAPQALSAIKGLAGSKAAQAGLAGAAAAGGAQLIHRLGQSSRLKEAEQLAKIAEESAEKRLKAIRGSGVRRHKGKGFFDVINKGLDFATNPIGELANLIPGVSGLGVRRPRRGRVTETRVEIPDNQQFGTGEGIRHRHMKHGGNIFKDIGASGLGQALGGPLAKVALFGLGAKKKKAPRKGKGFLSSILGVPAGIASSFGLGARKRKVGGAVKKKKGKGFLSDTIGALTNPLFIPASLARGSFGSTFGLGARKHRGGSFSAPGY